MQCRDQSPLLRLHVVLLWMAQAAGYRTPRFLTFKQALELGGHVRKGERGTKVYFVKQLQVRDKGADDDTATRIVPMLREYTIFNVDQCENLPERIVTPAAVKPRDSDERSAAIDEFLACTGASIREGFGECLDHVVVLGERHLRHVQLSYMNYYNETRTHLSLDKDAPLSRTVQRAGRILRLPILGGLHHQYIRI